MWKVNAALVSEETDPQLVFIYYILYIYKHKYIINIQTHFCKFSYRVIQKYITNA